MSKINKLETEKAPAAVGPYSQGTQIENWVFVSGQLPIDPETGELVDNKIEVQTERVIENLKSVLLAAGLDLSNVLRCDVFLKDMNDFKAMNEVYARNYTMDPKPARQAVQVAKLPLDALVEISCIAHK